MQLKTKISQRPQTTIIILICILAYLVDASLFNFTPFKGEKLSWFFGWGMGSGGAALNGEWWRFLTNGFLHLDLFHLIYNLLILWVLGGLNEKNIGKYYWLIYILIQIQSNCVAFFLLPAGAVGSSGAVFGIAGYFIARFFSAKDRSYLLVGSNYIVISLLLISLVLGFVPSTNSLAYIIHVSGFLFGIMYRIIELSFKGNINKSIYLFSFVTISTLGIFFKLPYVTNRIFYQDALSCLKKYQKISGKYNLDLGKEKIVYCDLIAEDFERIPVVFINQINNCHEGKLESCDLMVGIYYAIKKNELATEYLSIMCEKNDYDSCNRLGYNYSILNDKKNTIFYLEKACANNIVNACYNLGLFYLNNNQFLEAIRVYENGCNLDDADSCANLGFTYSKIGKNFEKEKIYATKACALGSHIGCYNSACNFCLEGKKNYAIAEFKKSMYLMNKATTEELEHALEDKDLDCIKNDQIWVEYVEMLKTRHRNNK